MQPLRVLYIVDDLRAAGAQRVVVQDACSFDAARVAAQVVVLSDRPGDTFLSDLTSRDIPVRFVTGRGLRDPVRLARLVRFIRTERPDVIFTHLAYANIIGLLAARLAGRPAIAAMHVLTADQQRWDAPKRILQSIILRLCAQRIVVVARSALEETRRMFHLPAEKLVVLPNVVDIDRLALPDGFDRAEKRQHLGAAPGETVICTVARLEQSKGQHILLRAAAALAPRFPAVRYLFAGTGPQQPSLQEQAASAGLANRVSFLGTRRDVPEILAASDLFVLPSLSEVLPLALLEAMALAKPVVATCVGGVPDVVTPGETGWLVPPGAPEALAVAIADALADPQRAAAYGVQARNLMLERCTPAAHVSGLEAIFRDVLRVQAASHKPTAGCLA